ncbi:short coiled-coil protein A isoform X1 [Labeo rohita]|uniref:short coiled-coil protein A isoform X1 n=2 Tax=Labeo rohita TaxID=84645 RepID=UPI0021E3257D|nr:short coiled-coil protein A isoform X1 [Labeo rohita]
MDGDVDEDDGTFTNISLADDSADGETTVLRFRPEDQSSTMNCEIDGKYHPQFGDMENQVEQEEKTRLINQVLELQHTLEDLSARVDAVKEENLKLKSENQVLGQYIENLMSASSVFQTTDTKSKRK